MVQNKFIDLLKNIIPTVVLLCGLYYALEGRIRIVELRLDAKKIRIEKLENQKETDTKTYHELIRSIDKLNSNFENLDKRLNQETKK